MILSPPKTDELFAGSELVAGLSKSTILADFDFETYSPAGFVLENNKWTSLPGASKKGISAVGAARYTEHPEAEVLSLAYNLKNGEGAKLWHPGLPNPKDLFDHVCSGKLIEAWNCAFEYLVWSNICVPKYGWPYLDYHQLRDAMAKAHAFSLPGSLAEAADVLSSPIRKDKDGARLLKKFSIPRDITKNDSRLRIMPGDDPEDAQKLYDYNLTDIKAEAEISARIPDLCEFELEFWLRDQDINRRGVQIDLEAIEAAIKIVDQAMTKYNQELIEITDGKVSFASEVARLTKWINEEWGKTFPLINNLQAETIDEVLKQSTLPPRIRRVLEIRQLLNSAAIKKLYSMRNHVCRDGRIYDLFIYHKARTGRAAGVGPQLHNFPNSGLIVFECCSCDKKQGRHDENCVGCKRHYVGKFNCPWCSNKDRGKAVEWNERAAKEAIETLKTESLEYVEFFWKDALGVISGCLRGMIIAKPGHQLIGCDYNSIEAIVLAAVAGEEWRLEVFKTHGKIYEMSASKITGIAFEEFEEHKRKTGNHHPLRKSVGKVAELASGYQGWIGAWKQFGADEFFNDDQIKQSILAWREASPKIVALWYKLEHAAQSAVLNPGVEHDVNNLITYVKRGDVLYCRLPSGRYLTYHRPQLINAAPPRQGFQLTFESWNTNAKFGAAGWIRMPTYGGKLTENVVQAIARDILAHAIVQLEKAGYPVIMHVHDEIVLEVLSNSVSVEAIEKIMIKLPFWCPDWPIRATGGWIDDRYKK